MSFGLGRKGKGDLGHLYLRPLSLCLSTNKPIPPFPYHVSRRATGGGQEVELVLIDNSRQSKVSNEQLAILGSSFEQQVLGLLS